MHLKLFAMLIRSAVMPRQWLKKMRRTLPDGIVCAGMHAPSRDIGRSISVELYESAGRDNAKPAPVLVNMHGSVVSLKPRNLSHFSSQVRIYDSITGHR